MHVLVGDPSHSNRSQQEEGGQLTEAVRKAPHSVVLLDELEKAHPDVLNVLLQIMEDGMLTDGKGRTVNFKNTILIMTSNVGSQRIMELSKLEAAARDMNGSNGETLAGDAESLYARLSDVVKEELETTMRPELLNRMDEIVIFSPLSDSDLRSIAQLIMDKTVERAQVEQDLDLTVTPALTQVVTDEGSSNAAQFGARPMRRAAQRFFEDAISDAIVRGFLEKGDGATVGLNSASETDRYYAVDVKRARDGTSLNVAVEKVSGGIGSSASALADESIDDDVTTARRKKRRSDPELEVETEPTN